MRYDFSYKKQIAITLVILILGIVGLFTENDITVPIFFIIISALSFLVVLTDYIAELKSKIK